MKYKDKLKKALEDNDMVAVEFLLIWLVIMMTGIFILVALGLLLG